MSFKRFQHDGDKEIDEEQYSTLSQIFAKDPEKGKEQSQKYFIKSTNLTYDKFIEEVGSTQKTKSCIFSWNSSTLCGQCFDCQITSSTCFCIDCFLEGHHDQHNSCIYYADSGCCDCGNPSFINPSGFCPKHPGQDLSPDVTQMTAENRKKFITFFKAAFSGALNCKSDYKMKSTLDFIKHYIVFGDGLRRCAAIGIHSVCKTDFYPKLPKMSEMRVKAIIDLFGQLVSDLYFLQKMSLLLYQNYEALANRLSKYIVGDDDDDYDGYDDYDDDNEDEHNSIRTYFEFMYHFFSKYSVEYCSHKENFNWPVFLTNYIKISLDTIRKAKSEYDKNYECSTLIRLDNVDRFLSNALSLEDQHDNIQDFINKYCNMLVDYEGMISFYVRTTPQDDYDSGYNLLIMMIIFGNINKFFTPNSKSEKFKAPNNKIFSISGCISALYQFYQSNNFEVESIMNSVKKTKISTCLPLHHLFFCLLQNHKDTKTLVEKECNKQGIDFQRFCFLAIICPLRFLASTFQSGKFTKLNSAFICAMKQVIDNPQCSFNGLFGLVQTIIGIAPNKEQLLEEVFETFGVFDNISDIKDLLEDENEIDRQSYLLENTAFEASIFILSLLTDRSIISLENIYFNRLRTIELLKQGRATAEKIEKYTGEQLNNQAFADDLTDFIERVTNKKGESYFRLKNEDDFTPFFPPIHVNNRMQLLMSYSDKLIKMNDYTELPREISLKGCFRTPAFIGLTFHMLSLTNVDITYRKIGLALFVCLVKNGPKMPDDSFNVENPVSIIGKDLKEIISELTKVENKLNDINVLTINIQLGDKEPTSIIKLVQSYKQLGNLAIEKAELSSSLQMKDEKISQKVKESKAKAALLRERLMKDFQNRRKQFGESSKRVSKSQITKPEPPKPQQEQQQQQQVNNDNDEDDLESNQEFNESEIVCNVCLSNQDDIYGFPCLSLPTTLPMIVNDHLHKLNTPQACIDDTFTMSICSHHIHYKCYIQLLKEELRRKETEYDEQPKKTSVKGPICELYHCTMDRGYRNCFLPLFESPTADDEENAFTKKPPIMTKVAITDFIRRAYNERAASYISIPMKSYASIVMMFEIRHRNRPDTLDAANIPILLRNLLLTLYHGLHQRAVKEDLDNSLNDPLCKLVYEIIKSENPADDFIQNVQKVASGITKPDFLYEFLRRAKIIEEFAIKTIDTKGELIDWDDVLSFESLIEKFGISTQKSDTEIELPLFETIKLPEKFIHLYQHPYEYDITSGTDSTAVDLITGELCYYMPSMYSSSRCLEINEYVDYVYKGGVGMFLCLTGSNASNLIFYSSILDKKWDQYSVYIDQLGDSNPGFKRGIDTSLSEDKLENALDALLSGNIVLY